MSRSSTSSSAGGEKGSGSGSGNSDLATATGGGVGVGVGVGFEGARGDRITRRSNHAAADDDENVNEDSSDYNDHDPQMTRLLHRLRREHATNFGNHRGGDGGGIAGDSGVGRGITKVNRSRARYLLEASAGNVGLASALYWEDYLAEAEGGVAAAAAAPDRMASGDGSGRASSAASMNDPLEDKSEELSNRSSLGSSSKRNRCHADRIGGGGGSGTGSGNSGVDSDLNIPQQKRYKRENSFGLDGSSPFSSSAHDEVVAAWKRPHNETANRGKAMAKKGGISRNHSLGSAGEDDDDNDDVARMQDYLRGSTTTLSSMHQFQRQLDEKISSLQERLSSYRWQWQNDAASAAFAAAPAPPERLSSYRTSQKLHQPPSSTAASASSLGNPNNDATMQAAISAALQLGSTTAASSSSGHSGITGPPNLWRLGHSDYLGDGSAFGLGLDEGHRSALLDSLPAGAGRMPPRMSMEEIHRAIQALQEGERFPPTAATARQFTSLANAAADAASLPFHQMNYGFGPPQFDWLSRTMPYNPYRAPGVGGAPPINDAGQQAVMAALLRDGSAPHAAASGGGEDGNGGDESDDDASSGGNAGRGIGSPRRDEREQDENNHASNRSNARDGFDDAAGNNGNAAEEEEDAGSMEAPLRRMRPVRRPPFARNLPPRPRPALMRRNHLDDADDDDMPADPEEAPWMVRRALRAAARAAAAAALANNNDASVDISDDDDAGFRPGPMPVFRLKKGGALSLIPTGKRKSLDNTSNETHNEAFDYSDDDDDYSTLSRDIDLLLHNSSSSFYEPSRNLWESYPRHYGETEGNDNAVEETENDSVIFPASWLRSGFKLAPCGNGLYMSTPLDDDRGRVNRSFSALREDPLKGIKGSFPYNCMGVSALLSIVSALLYSGASVQGGSAVACDVDRVPFHELSLDQRKREFDSRLTDALSSLIFVAAEAGSLRYKNMLKMYDRQWARRCRRKGHVSPEEEDIYTTKRMALQRRSRVCEVCWWPTDVVNGGATIFPEGKDPRDVQYKTSFTNICDIKSYVKTNLRSFKEPGGCALFLETIVHCHSKSIHLPPCFPLNCDYFSLSCKCSQTLKHFQTTTRNKNGDTNVMIVPEDNDCMTVEFFSLLLTGHVYHNYENWSADMFGIGILRINANAQNKLGPRLLRPIKPVWICLGDLGYSMLFLDMKSFIGHTSTLDDPGKSFQLAHWNCWSGELTKFRVTTSMRDEKVGILSGHKKPILIPCTSSDSEEEGRTIVESISARQHLEQKRDAPMPWEQENINENLDGANPKSISDDELQSVTFHPEDKKYYPGQYRRWRFQFVCASAPGSSAEYNWTPFYRLHGRQRLVVEMRLAPRICTLIRSRWPLATVRDFEGKVPMI